MFYNGYVYTYFGEFNMARVIEQKEVSLSKLVLNKSNVRHRLPTLGELEDSIEERGIIEPLIVRPKGDKYEIVIGQLRYLAAKNVGLDKVPTIVKEMTDGEARTESLIENVIRHQLEPEDEIDAVAELYKVYNSQEKLAKALGKSTRWIQERLQAKGLIETIKSATPRHAVGRELPRDTTKTARIASVAKHVYEEEPEKQIELFETLKEKPREDVKRVLDYVKIYPEKPVEEAVRETLLEPKRIRITVEFSGKVSRAILEIANERGISREDVVEIAVEQWLERGGHLD